ncbi:MAG: cysteine desulfurase [archaeon GB-1867-035]|nr:cysteine desulfurase [Candidatus Culexmicrobium profundum]
MTDIIRSVKDLIEIHGKPKREVYLDSENSGLIFPEALEEMISCYRETGYGHPSITHKIGWMSYEKIFKSTQILADFINSSVDEIAYFHSGTEANNVAVTGLARAYKNRGKKIIVSSIEHFSVIFPAEKLENYGYRVVKIPVDEYGFINVDSLSNAVDKDTLLVSIAAVNHEIGTIQDIRGLVEIVKDKNPQTIFHTDAADALGKINFDVDRLGVDLATFSGHKVYGPKGVGVLYIKEGIKLEPVIYGQLSTQRLWPGVENIPAIAGFAKAIEIIRNNFDTFVFHMRSLRDDLIDGLLENIPYTLLNGPKGDRRAPDNVNVSFLYCEGEALTIELSMRGIYVSSGSACTSRLLEPSHVLLAIGRKHEEAHGSVLMKVTPMHTIEDVKYVLSQFPQAISRIRSLSPLKPEE